MSEHEDESKYEPYGEGSDRWIQRLDTEEKRRNTVWCDCFRLTRPLPFFDLNEHPVRLTLDHVCDHACDCTRKATCRAWMQQHSDGLDLTGTEFENLHANPVPLPEGRYVYGPVDSFPIRFHSKDQSGQDSGIHLVIQQWAEGPYETEIVKELERLPSWRLALQAFRNKCVQKRPVLHKDNPLFAMRSWEYYIPVMEASRELAAHGITPAPTVVIYAIACALYSLDSSKKRKQVVREAAEKMRRGVLITSLCVAPVNARSKHGHAETIFQIGGSAGWLRSELKDHAWQVVEDHADWWRKQIDKSRYVEFDARRMRAGRKSSPVLAEYAPQIVTAKTPEQRERLKEAARRKETTWRLENPADRGDTSPSAVNAALSTAIRREKEKLSQNKVRTNNEP